MSVHLLINVVAAGGMLLLVAYLVAERARAWKRAKEAWECSTRDLDAMTEMLTAITEAIEIRHLVGDDTAWRHLIEGVTRAIWRDREA